MRTALRYLLLTAVISIPLPARAQQVVQGGEDLLHFSPLDYPSHLRDNNIQGTVVLQTVLDEKGHVLDARVDDGPIQLRRIALAAVLAFHFAPVKEGTTRQVAIRYQLPMSAAPNAKGLYKGGPRPMGVAPAERRSGTLKTVDVSELSDRMKRELAARLPVREGQLVAAEDWPKIQQAVWAIDEHLELKLTVLDRAARPSSLALQLLHPRSFPAGPPPPPPDKKE